MRGRGIPGGLILLWMAVGFVAAWQRDYFEADPTSCTSAGTIAITVVAGPLNYLGVNPKIKDCRLPEPSSMQSIDLIPVL